MTPPSPHWRHLSFLQLSHLRGGIWDRKDFLEGLKGSIILPFLTFAFGLFYQLLCGPAMKPEVTKIGSR